MAAQIENYLDFPAGIPGAELADRAVVQAHEFPATSTIPGEAQSLDRVDGHFVVGLTDGALVEEHTVVLATGVRYRNLVIRHDNLNRDMSGSSRARPRTGARRASGPPNRACSRSATCAAARSGGWPPPSARTRSRSAGLRTTCPESTVPLVSPIVGVALATLPSMAG